MWNNFTQLNEKNESRKVKFPVGTRKTIAGIKLKDKCYRLFFAEEKNRRKNR